MFNTLENRKVTWHSSFFCGPSDCRVWKVSTAYCLRFTSPQMSSYCTSTGTIKSTSAVGLTPKNQSVIWSFDIAKVLLPSVPATASVVSAPPRAMKSHLKHPLPVVAIEEDPPAPLEHRPGPGCPGPAVRQQLLGPAASHRTPPRSSGLSINIHANFCLNWLKFTCKLTPAVVWQAKHINAIRKVNPSKKYWIHIMQLFVTWMKVIH